MMSRFLSRVHRAEDGSMVLALLAVIVAGGLMTVLVASTVASQRATRFDQNYTQLAHVAETGLNQALYLLDEDAVHSSYSPNCPGLLATPPVPCATTKYTEINGVRAYWMAAQTVGSSEQWVLTAVATRNNVTRRVQVTATRGRRFPAALYTEIKMHLTGSQSVASYNSTTGASGTGNGDIQSGGTLQAGAVGSDSETPTAPLKLSNSENMQFITTALNSCATKPAWVASTAGGRLELSGAGPHCFSSMVFDTNTVVVGSTAAPTIVYVEGRVEFANKAKVYVASCATCAETLPRQGAAFQVYSAGTEVLFTKDHAITGAIYAPRADCRGNVSMPHTTIYGSLVCATLKTNGQFQVLYDDEITNIKSGPFMPVRWTEL